MNIATRAILLFGVSAALLLAADAFVGSWKLNLQKSRVSNPDNFKDRRQVFEALGPIRGILLRAVGSMAPDARKATWSCSMARNTPGQTAPS
jgi:hypothetical protein